MKRSMVSPVENFVNRFDGPFSTAFQTGAQFGLPLAFSCLAGLPFASRQTKMLASGIGGALPLIARTLPGFWASEQDVGQAAWEARLSTIEIGAGIAVSLLPSLRWIFVANTLLAFGGEIVRETLVWKKSLREAASTALLASGFTLALGELAYRLPLIRAKRPFEAWGGDEKGWGRVRVHLQGEERERYLSAVRQRMSEPTVEWYRAEERRVLKEMGRLVGRLEKTLEGGSDKGVEEIMRILEGRRQEMIRAMTVHSDYYGQANQGELELLRLDAFFHELEHEKKLAFGFEDSREGIRGLRNLFAHQADRRRPLPSSLNLTEDRHMMRGQEVAIHVRGLPRLDHDQAFDVSLIVREWARNGLKAANRRGVQPPRVMISLYADSLEFTNNAGPFTPLQRIDPREIEAIRRKLWTGDIGGLGQKIILAIVQDNRWALTDEAIEGGIKYTLRFRPSAVV